MWSGLALGVMNVRDLACTSFHIRYGVSRLLAQSPNPLQALKHAWKTQTDAWTQTDPWREDPLWRCATDLTVGAIRDWPTAMAARLEKGSSASSGDVLFSLTVWDDSAVDRGRVKAP